MKRLICLCVLAAVFVGCGPESTLPNDFLDQLFGTSTPDGTAGSQDQGGSNSQGGTNGQTGSTDSPSHVFADSPGIPQAGAQVPEIGGQLSIRVISRSRVAATVTIRFLIDDVEVHLSQLHVGPFEILDAVGPDTAVRAECTGTYVTGRSTPPLLLMLGQGFEQGDIKEYIIPDPDDTCPDDPDKFEPGVCGCGVPDTDSDGDGAPDCNDQCPNDPTKTEPGACGCGVPDTDSDGDETPDCNDACPNDPDKTSPGTCGCGTPDTDSDGDGTPDCKDECPNDPHKTSPGTCGCGTPEGSCGNGGGGGGGETTYALSVSISPTGAGSVGQSPSAARYTPGTTVTLTAQPNTGYVFDHWEGAATGTSEQTQIAMDGNKSVTAVFKAAGSPASRLYVNAAAPSGGDGRTWATAFNDLQSALIAAGASQGVVKEIWVAKGVYKPAAPGGDRSATFVLLNGVEIYGGFAGTEVARDQCDPAVNITTLSGDLNGDDTASFADTDDNSYHVVTGSGTDATAVLSGFVIAGGNATGAPVEVGGGMFNWGGSPTLTRCTFTGNSGGLDGGGMANLNGSNPTLDTCTFRGNTASLDGGGVYDGQSSPTLTNCTFSENLTQSGAGGGMANLDGSTPTLTNCTFIGNSAASGGGGMFNWTNASPTLSDCAFNENTAGSFGGGICNDTGSTGCSFLGNTAAQGGAILSSGATLNARNCAFSTNAANEGGAIYAGGGTTTLLNCTLAANKAPTDGGALCNEYADTAVITLTNCVVWGNAIPPYVPISGAASVSYSCVERGYSGPGNIDRDPMFIHSPDPGPDGIWNTDDDLTDLRLAPGSSCVDAGDNGPVHAAGITTDLRGRPRFTDDPASPDGGSGSSPIVDMGAYESQAPADFDADTDVDLVDFAHLQSCFNGPNRPAAKPSCEDADLDGDRDVDLTDFFMFQTCFNGPNRPQRRWR
jgi:uncharacterized repeat protein (TIGR02543 family)